MFKFPRKESSSTWENLDDSGYLSASNSQLLSQEEHAQVLHNIKKKLRQNNSNEFNLPMNDPDVRKAFAHFLASDKQTTREHPKDNNSTNYQRLRDMQKRRNVGIYVHCDMENCNKLRYLPDVVDPLELPEKWYCDLAGIACSCAQEDIPAKTSKLFIENKYHVGSLVWVKYGLSPWWPAMVEDDQKTDNYFKLPRGSIVPIKYHVTFFGNFRKVSAWIKTDKLKPFKLNLNNPEMCLGTRSRFKKEAKAAVAEARLALEINPMDRLEKYSVLSRITDVKKSRNCGCCDSHLIKKNAKQARVTVKKSDEKENVSPTKLRCSPHLRKKCETKANISPRTSRPLQNKNINSFQAQQPQVSMKISDNQLKNNCPSAVQDVPGQKLDSILSVMRLTHSQYNIWAMLTAQDPQPKLVELNVGSDLVRLGF